VEPVPRAQVSAERSLRRSRGAFPVREKALIRLAGADCRRYLNGQLTIDINRLPPGEARRALLLTAKGKLCSSIQVWGDDDGFIVETEASLLEETAARLERYIISDDVTISMIPEKLPVYHVFGVLPPDDALRINRIGTPGYDCPAPPAEIPAVDDSDVELLRIERGIPLWGSELTADTLPQEAGLDQSSVDFDKGCYVGQEVVSRLRSVGHVNRLLRRFSGSLPTPLDSPVSLLSKSDPSRPAGTLTSAARDFELAQTLALGYLNREFVDVLHFLATDATGKVIGELEKRPV